MSEGGDSNYGDIGRDLGPLPEAMKPASQTEGRPLPTGSQKVDTDNSQTPKSDKGLGKRLGW